MLFLTKIIWQDKLGIAQENKKAMKKVTQRVPVQADLQSADLEYQHLQCENKRLAQFAKTIIFATETTV